MTDHTYEHSYSIEVGGSTLGEPVVLVEGRARFRYTFYEREPQTHTDPEHPAHVDVYGAEVTVQMVVINGSLTWLGVPNSVWTPYQSDPRALLDALGEANEETLIAHARDELRGLAERHADDDPETRDAWEREFGENGEEAALDHRARNKEAR